MQKPINIEGYSPDDVLALSHEEQDALVFCGRPIVFRAGTAQILGEFRLLDDRLEVELAQIDGGGEGVLSTLWLLAERVAEAREVEHVDWIVHALTCAKPNLKLRRLLERKGFTIRKIAGGVEAFYYRHSLGAKRP